MHDEHPRSRNELWFARQLRDAARREQPPFSESLHQRIMQAVRPTAAESPNGLARRRTHWRSAAWLTVAAAIFAMVIAVRWFGGSQNHGGLPSQTGSTASVAVRPVPIVKQPVDVVPATPIKNAPHDAGSNELASLAGNYTLDDLTRDAQATAHLLVDQLPFETPADEWGL